MGPYFVTFKALIMETSPLFSESVFGHAILSTNSGTT